MQICAASFTWWLCYLLFKLKDIASLYVSMTVGWFNGSMGLSVRPLQELKCEISVFLLDLFSILECRSFMLALHWSLLVVLGWAAVRADKINPTWWSVGKAKACFYIFPPSRRKEKRWELHSSSNHYCSLRLKFCQTSRRYCLHLAMCCVRCSQSSCWSCFTHDYAHNSCAHQRKSLEQVGGRRDLWLFSFESETGQWYTCVSISWMGCTQRLIVVTVMWWPGVKGNSHKCMWTPSQLHHLLYRRAADFEKGRMS